jgi:hypothetical protein
MISNAYIDLLHLKCSNICSHKVTSAIILALLKTNLTLVIQDSILLGNHNISLSVTTELIYSSDFIGNR